MNSIFLIKTYIHYYINVTTYFLQKQKKKECTSITYSVTLQIQMNYSKPNYIIYNQKLFFFVFC
jgi:hypothetical protein